MFIECEKCRSIYEMDSTLLKPEGSRVRCSVCGFVFTARPEPEVHEDSGMAEDGGGDQKERPAPAKEEPPDLSELLKELEISTRGRQAVKADEPMGEKAPGRNAAARPTKGGAREPIKPYRFEDKKKRSYLRTVLLLCILFLVGAAGSVVIFAPELIPWKIPFITTAENREPDTGAKWLSLSEVKGAFVESGPSGRLFVIRGLVRNNDKAARGMILLKASLLDQKGLPIRSIQLYAGNSREDSRLAEMDINAIRAAMANRAGDGNSNLRLEPGASIPFMAVFDNLPENLSEFAVEPVASSPVGR